MQLRNSVALSFFLCAGIIAGVIQLILGVIRAGSITNYIPVAVIEGMLAGIGFLIIIKQLPYAIGTDKLLFNGTDSFINIHSWYLDYHAAFNLHYA